MPAAGRGPGGLCFLTIGQSEAAMTIHTGPVFDMAFSRFALATPAVERGRLPPYCTAAMAIGVEEAAPRRTRGCFGD